LLAATAFAVAAVAGFSPSRAQARCGDYVLVGGQAMGHASKNGSDSALELTRTERGASTMWHAPDPSRGSACTGPHCSSDVPQPSGAPTEPFKIVVRDSALLSAAGSQSSVDARRLSLEDHPAVCPLWTGAIYRPPR